MMSANKVAEMPINRGVGDFLKVYKIWKQAKLYRMADIRYY